MGLHMEPAYAQALAKSAASDANREAVDAQRASDFPWIKNRIVESLTCLGFKFVELNSTVYDWEALQNEPTLIETRLNADGVTFTRTTDVPQQLAIPTTHGEFTVDLKNREWQGPYTYLGNSGGKTRTEGFLSTVAGYDYMLNIIEKHFQPQKP